MAKRGKRQAGLSRDMEAAPQHRARVPRSHLGQEYRERGDMDTAAQLTRTLTGKCKRSALGTQ